MAAIGDVIDEKKADIDNDHDGAACTKRKADKEDVFHGKSGVQAKKVKRSAENQVQMKSNLVGTMNPSEASLRYDLAVAHRLVAKMGMDMLVWNHISARFLCDDNHSSKRSSTDPPLRFLITPGRKLWNRITPHDLVLESDNVTANVIHSAIYRANDTIRAIIHLHTPAATAVSCLKGGFQPLFQDAAYFYQRVAYYNWDGLSNDEAEAPALIHAVQSVPGCNTLVLNNHGFVCFGRSVKEVFILAYYFERCCDVQLRVMQSGGGILHPSKKVMEAAAVTSFLPEFAPGNCEWEALCGEVDFEEEEKKKESRRSKFSNET